MNSVAVTRQPTVRHGIKRWPQTVKVIIILHVKNCINLIAARVQRVVSISPHRVGAADVLTANLGDE